MTNEYKTCFKCKETKPEDKFIIKKGKRATCCKLCKSRYYKGKKWQGGVGVRGPKFTKEEQKKKAKEYKKNYRKRNQVFIKDYLAARCCQDCGETNLLVLEFDHRDPNRKKKEIGVLIGKGASIKTLQEEINKCDIVCANCHRIRTFNQFGSWRLSV